MFARNGLIGTKSFPKAISPVSHTSSVEFNSTARLASKVSVMEQPLCASGFPRAPKPVFACKSVGRSVFALLNLRLSSEEKIMRMLNSRLYQFLFFRAQKLFLFFRRKKLNIVRAEVFRRVFRGEHKSVPSGNFPIFDPAISPSFSVIS